MHRGALRLVALAALAVVGATGAAAGAAPAPAGGGGKGAIPQRICSVSLMGDELLFLLVPPERVVCVSSFADDAEASNVAGRYPASVPRLVARTEPVLAARPDLIVAAPWNDRAFLSGMKALGVRSLTLDAAEDFEGIERTLLALGKAVGADEAARARAAELRARLLGLERALSRAQPLVRPRVLSLSHLVVAGSGTTVDALIRRAGGVNAAAAIEGHRKLSAEQILALDPDVLLLGQGLDTDAVRVLRAYPQLEATRAAKTGRVILLPPRLLTTVTPFLVEGAEQLARKLHPEAFR
ncbi:MAG: ABC transporter substrate-binding protein [Acidobacteria bacterium]|jgi:iron complex transport system substrate-binding protein|nr:ABC transporter substrate-binding protein [Acidobacteriota bacterium]